MTNKVELYDTTLRDGTQQEGISLSVEDKLAITERLDQLGIDVIEGGYAGANPKDDEYFQRVQSLDLKHAQIAAFGNTRRANVDAANDPTLKALLDTNAPVVTLVGKSSEYQVKDVLQTSLEENLAMIADSVTYLKEQGRRVFFDAEHFFDGFKMNAEYATQALRVAMDAGAERLILCDTNGGTLPSEVADIVKRIMEDLGDDAVIGIHSHNDTDTAVASAIAAVEAGAFQVQGCINGYGERTGNANMVSVIGNLNLKMGVEAISKEQLETLTEVSNFVSERVNRSPDQFQPFVGSSAFSHKGGLHAAATQKSAQAYQHIEPSLVGNSNDVVISELSGRGNIVHRIKEMGLADDLDDAAARQIVQHVKDQESKGFSYEGANASFDLVLRRALPNYEAPFELVDFMVVIENRRRSSFGTGWRKDGAEHPMLSEATVKVRVGEEIMHTAAEGDGPVGALDGALRKGLVDAYPELSAIRLTDYKVRVVNEGVGTGAAVRVVIESADGKDVWYTVGASTNILEASWLALTDSFEWWLFQNGVAGK
ncbi:citramalate synthase [Candidatus Lucifugimonas marina]|uniref:Citramalate synthase n=1 Tax=Candidatus Lucifugimonas marina TaxID=3038979 RepID=A0AAJ6CTZ4_9CHLR|nr:citramalate synthase [SAR202 cluster bacterium JH702]MDG0870283.1 citramalate synthase [SAR202 cluster bacterium JH639]WFG36156.1 citramalate synthase [SAR202 cluster bacterium JH545]WFG40102.1 citramalate synthase [SAR202 cluster bacterium JH1073]